MTEYIPTGLTLVAQTNDVAIANPTQDTIVTANLQTPYPLTIGVEYWIGVITDSPVYTSFSYWQIVPRLLHSHALHHLPGWRRLPHYLLEQR